MNYGTPLIYSESISFYYQSLSTIRQLLPSIVYPHPLQQFPDY